MRQSRTNFNQTGSNSSNPARAQGQGSQQMCQPGIHFHSPNIGNQTAVSMVFNSPGNYAVNMDLHGSQAFSMDNQGTGRRSTAHHPYQFGVGRGRAAQSHVRSTSISSSSSDTSSLDMDSLHNFSSLSDANASNNVSSNFGLNRARGQSGWNNELYFRPTSTVPENQSLLTMRPYSCPAGSNGNGRGPFMTTNALSHGPTYGQGQANLALNIDQQQQQMNNRTPPPPVLEPMIPFQTPGTPPPPVLEPMIPFQTPGNMDVFGRRRGRSY